jgi:hypothetical protein
MSDPIAAPPAGQSPITLTKKPAAKSASIITAAIVGVAGLGAGFGVGRATAPTKTASFQGMMGDRNGGAFPRPSGSAGAGGFGGGMMRGDGNGPSLTGTVQSIANGKVTMKLTNGKVVSFAIDTTTKVSKNVAAKSTDVATGSTVAIQVQGAQLGQLFQGSTDNIDLGVVTTVTVH